MESPAEKVPQGLLAHIHLLSAQPYPQTPQQLPLEQALDQLLFAPRVVGSLKPVSWQYIRPPPDGTIFLAWQPTAQLGNTFATDGYVFPGPENVFPQQCRGYAIEIFLDDSGYIPGQEPVATHRRVRYRLVGSPGGQPVDPALELVHYTQSPREKHVPANRVPPDQQKQAQLKERQYLEEQGQLIRKEFMLYDKHNWPNISMPGRQTPAMATNPYQRGGMPAYPGGFPPGMARPPGPPQPFHGQAPGMRPQMMQPSPAKRQRTSAAPPPGGMRMPDLGPMEEEENSYIGDVLDLMTPREISMMRYKQHHEWMEEILSSAYAVDKILPAGLKFQLAGEMSSLTKDLFAEEKTDEEQPRKIKAEDVTEFEKRVEAYQTKERDEMAGMQARHKSKVEELSRQQVWVQLEQRLAKASSAAAGGGETVDDIIREVEKGAGTRVGSREEVVRVRKGGMLDREETLAAARQNQEPEHEEEPEDNGQMQGTQDEFGEFTNLDTAGEALDFYSGDYSDMTFGT